MRIRQVGAPASVDGAPAPGRQDPTPTYQTWWVWVTEHRAAPRTYGTSDLERRADPSAERVAPSVVRPA